VTLGDRPLLAHAIGALAAGGAVDAIVVVTTAERRAALLAGDWLPAGRITFADGGDRRQDSVRAGFEALERAVPDPAGERVVLVHDGARPMVSRALIADVIAAVGRYGAAIPALPVAETLKRVADDRIAGDRRPVRSRERPDPAGRSTPSAPGRHSPRRLPCRHVDRRSRPAGGL
jgi:2-C-methyl-D-erythritol 4-phosphate cytidylyltransferase